MGQRIDFIESGKKATTMRFGLQVGTSLATAHSTTTLATSNTILPNNRQARGFHRPLTQAKKNKRRRLGLCLYCGRSGHFVAKCPIAPKRTKVNRKSLKEFTIFSRLPLELRREIWEWALPSTPKGFRMVKVEEWPTFDSATDTYLRCYSLKYSEDSDVVRDVKLSEVNFEARTVYLETYRQEIRTNRGIIRLAMRDILYVVNALTYTGYACQGPASDVQTEGPVWETLPIRNLAISTLTFFDSIGWGPETPPHISPMSSGYLSTFRISGFLGLVEHTAIRKGWFLPCDPDRKGLMRFYEKWPTKERYAIAQTMPVLRTINEDGTPLVHTINDYLGGHSESEEER